MTEWQPIKTAPKNNFKEILVAYYDEDILERWVIDIAAWQALYLDGSAFGWLHPSQGGEAHMEIFPEYWMPLPKPPLQVKDKCGVHRVWKK